MLTIAGRRIGADHPPFVIAEVAQSHDGSLGNALAFAEVARDCGADAIKFQTHIASEESTPSEPWRVPFSRQDASRYAYWQRMEFTFDQWAILKKHCDDLGIIFLSSPFSLKACDWLEQLGMPAWKIASGELHNRQIIDRIVATKQPMLLSTGLAAPDVAMEAVRRVIDAGSPAGLFHCTTKYPTPPEEVGLNVLSEYLAALPGVPIGLSDHSGNPFAAIIAAYLGASLIEVHLTLHAKAFGPDVSSSLVPQDLATLVHGVRAAWTMRTNPVDKHRQLAELNGIKTIFGRSIYTTGPIAAGTVMSEDMISYRKPGGGLTYEAWNSIIGQTASRELPADHRIEAGDVR